jgi:hypothetical protein
MTSRLDKKTLFRRIDEIFDKVPDREVPDWDRVE